MDAVKIEGMTTKKGWAIAGSISFGGALLAFIGGFLISRSLGNSQAAFIGSALAFAWLTTYTVLGLEIVRQQEFRVVERLGRYYRTYKQGIKILCLPGLIDKLRRQPMEEGRLKCEFSYRWQRLNLFGGSDQDQMMDFTDGSAKMEAYVWFMIYDPRLFVYGASSSLERLEELVDNFIRPRVQNLSLDEANQKMRDVIREFTEEAKKGEKPDSSEEETFRSEIRSLGLDLKPKNPLVIADIDIPTELKLLRSKVMEGEKEGEAAKRRGAGYGKAIRAIMDQFNNENVEKDGKTIRQPIIGEDGKLVINCTFEQAWQIFERQRGLETLGSTGANITLVSADVKGLMATIGVGNKNQ